MPTSTLGTGRLLDVHQVLVVGVKMKVNTMEDPCEVYNGEVDTERFKFDGFPAELGGVEGQGDEMVGYGSEQL